MSTETNQIRPAYLVNVADGVRRLISGGLGATRSELGQFLTPGPIAEFMAGMFDARGGRVRILDPGAGVGTLTAALVQHLLAQSRPPREITATCYEVDSRLIKQLERTVAACRDFCRSRDVRLALDIRREDYIESRAKAAAALFGGDTEVFDCVVMNPPYRKINGQSNTRLRLRTIGVETSNLYSAFMILAARQLAPEGEFASITPRSFCNGPYFRAFRKEFLRLVKIRRLHVFESRSNAFKDDEILQENVITYGVRDVEPGGCVNVSVTRADGKLVRRTVRAAEVVSPIDPDAIIHIVTDAAGAHAAHRLRQLTATLDSLGLDVSTGRVVDFRTRQYLRQESGKNTVPLIYSAHFHRGEIRWPNGNSRKPNAIVACEATAHLLVSAGIYVLTKRFSAKEERRRLVAAVCDPRRLEAEQFGFDNKTNYFHSRGGGMDEMLARGLAVFLNSSVVDGYFRLFSGHTQVNAADLRRLPYPSLEQLRTLGNAATDLEDQAAVDGAVARLF